MIFEVIDHNIPNILGLKTCVEPNLVQRLDTIDNQTADILHTYSGVFEGLGCITNVSYHIKVDKSAQPLYIRQENSLSLWGLRFNKNLIAWKSLTS